MRTFWTKARKGLDRVAAVVGAVWGEFLLQTVRGFEFATALGTLNNAVFVLQTQRNGAPVASFLRGSTGLFTYSPLVWSCVFTAFGLTFLVLWFASMHGGGYFRHLKVRAVAYALLSVLYAVVSLQVLRSHEPPLLSGRYVVTLLLSMCCTVLLLRLIWNGNAKRRLQKVMARGTT